MDQVSHYATLLLHYADEGLDFLRVGFSHVNAFLGILIALLAAFQLSGWKKLWEVAVAATLIHVLARWLAPAVDKNIIPPLPNPVTLDFWRDVIALYLGYVILIAVFYFVRSKLMKGGGAAAHH